jgi:hypothetical protein
VTSESPQPWFTLFLRQKLHQLLDIGVHEINGQNLTGMVSDAQDEILADSIDDEEAVVVTAHGEPTGME